VRRGDHTLLMLGNRAALWESILALTKLGSVIIPSTTLLTASDIEDRVTRGHVAHVIAESAQAGQFTGVAGDYTRIAVGDPVEGWLPYDDFLSGGRDFLPDGPTAAGDPLFLYFTSGTTAKPKLVEHTATVLTEVAVLGRDEDELVHFVSGGVLCFSCEIASRTAP
jgi:acetyl-CoA synthetase